MGWFIIWTVIVSIVPIVVVYQLYKGINMTQREINFFFLGIVIAGIPFLYLVTNH